MKKIAILPIRSGSKRFPGKNFFPILGIPLYKLVLKKIIAANIFDDIVIATDEPDRVLDECNDLNIKIFHRSESSSSDFAQSEDILSEVIGYYKFSKDSWITLFQATNPFLKFKYLIQMNEAINKKIYTSIVTFVYHKRFSLNQVRSAEFSRNRTQDLVPQKLETGLFWSVQIEAFEENKSRITSSCFEIEIQKEDDWDIDEKSDLTFIKSRLECEILQKEKLYKSRKIELSDLESYYNDPVDPDGRKRNLLNETKGRLDFAKDEIKSLKNLLNADKLNKKVSVLDIGCGTGVISSHIFKNNAEIYGIEPSLAACEKAKSRLNHVYHGLYEEHTIDFKEEKFDFIIAFHVIEHVDQPNHLLDEIYRMLKPGGYILLSTPDFEGPLAKKFGDKFRLLHDKTHQSLFGTVGLLNSALSRGLTLTDLMFPYIDSKWMTAENLVKVLDVDNNYSPPFTGNVVSMILQK